jgi:hypothetical protein
MFQTLTFFFFYYYIIIRNISAKFDNHGMFTSISSSHSMYDWNETNFILNKKKIFFFFFFDDAHKEIHEKETDTKHFKAHMTFVDVVTNFLEVYLLLLKKLLHDTNKVHFRNTFFYT